MKAGRELDALVAEKVMGLAVYMSAGLGPILAEAIQDGSYKHVPLYSTDVAAAWEVAEKMSLPFELNCDDEHMLWNARFNLDRGEWAQSSTAPHAICLAALKACWVET